MKKSHDFNNLLKTPADTKTIIKRYFVNLIRIYKGENETEQREYLSKMFNDLDHMIIQKKISELTPDDIILGRQANFKIGQIIRHTRYNYHGLVVDLDQQCHAHDQWYYGNLTQPDRNQHWYHVLVHGSDQVTYVAESNLIADSSIKSIAHPLINHFFSHEKNGRYVRNDNPWPDSAM